MTVPLMLEKRWLVSSSEGVISMLAGRQMARTHPMSRSLQAG